jgi:hypothetical protein
LSKDRYPVRGHFDCCDYVAKNSCLSGTLPPNPLPLRAMYAGAKAFMLVFTQALAGELKATRVRVQVCLPGIVHTEFHTVQDFDTTQIGPQKMTAEDVVTASLAGLSLGEVVCIPALADTALLPRLAEAQIAVLKAAPCKALHSRNAIVSAVSATPVSPGRLGIRGRKRNRPALTARARVV